MTRQELYEQVWSTPLIQLSKSCRLSDVGLAKLCKKHGIPRPPRGYWAKMRAGQGPKQTPLPYPEDNPEIPLTIGQDHTEHEEQLRQVALESSLPQARIEVADNLRSAHALVSRAGEEFAVARVNEVGMLVVGGDPAINLYVSKPQLRRALLVMDALLKAIDDRGYAAAAGPAALIDGQRVDFYIEEQLVTVREQPPSHDLSGPYEFGHSRFLSRRTPSGRLSLQIPEARNHWAAGCRQFWRDAKKQRIEDCLHEVLRGLMEVAARKRQHEAAEQERRRLRDERERRLAEERQQRADRRKLKSQEQARLERLLELAESWRQARDLRDFIEAVYARHAEAGCPINSDSEIGEWLAWASHQADRFDPTTPSPPSILDEDIPDERPRSSWE